MIETVATDRGPKAIGPYSQAVRANGFVFLSGQIPLDPKTQQVVEGDVAAQTERVLENLKGVVEAAGSSLQRVVKTTVFLADMNDFAAMNEVYCALFHDASTRAFHRRGVAPPQKCARRNRFDCAALTRSDPGALVRRFDEAFQSRADQRGRTAVSLHAQLRAALFRECADDRPRSGSNFGRTLSERGDRFFPPAEADEHRAEVYRGVGQVRTQLQRAAKSAFRLRETTEGELCGGPIAPALAGLLLRGELRRDG